MPQVKASAKPDMRCAVYAIFACVATVLMNNRQLLHVSQSCNPISLPANPSPQLLSFGCGARLTVMWRMVVLSPRARQRRSRSLFELPQRFVMCVIEVTSCCERVGVIETTRTRDSCTVAPLLAFAAFELILRHHGWVRSDQRLIGAPSMAIRQLP